MLKSLKHWLVSGTGRRRRGGDLKVIVTWADKKTESETEKGTMM